MRSMVSTEVKGHKSDVGRDNKASESVKIAVLLAL